jgi:hypothetical protein
MSISTAKDYLDIFALIFNFYQSNFTEVDSKLDLTLLGVEKELNLADFFPDTATINDIDHDNDSNDFFHCLTDNEVSFKSYGLVTVKKGGMIYFESSETIIKEVVKVLGVFTRKAISAHLLHSSDIKFQKGNFAIDKKVVFKFGKLFDASHIAEEHLIVIRRGLKQESQGNTTEVPNLMLSLLLLLVFHRNIFVFNSKLFMKIAN